MVILTKIIRFGGISIDFRPRSAFSEAVDERHPEVPAVGEFRVPVLPGSAEAIDDDEAGVEVLGPVVENAGAAEAAHCEVLRTLYGGRGILKGIDLPVGQGQHRDEGGVDEQLSVPGDPVVAITGPQQGLDGLAADGLSRRGRIGVNLVEGIDIDRSSDEDTARAALLPLGLRQSGREGEAARIQHPVGVHQDVREAEVLRGHPEPFAVIHLDVIENPVAGGHFDFEPEAAAVDEDVPFALVALAGFVGEIQRQSLVTETDREAVGGAGADAEGGLPEKRAEGIIGGIVHQHSPPGIFVVPDIGGIDLGEELLLLAVEVAPDGSDGLLRHRQCPARHLCLRLRLRLRLRLVCLQRRVPHLRHSFHAEKQKCGYIYKVSDTHWAFPVRRQTA